MDDFGLGKPELNGTLMSLEFGQGGRIQQLWVMDPTSPEENEEFQFVAPPVTMGEEFAEDYFPGTILLGARTSPDEPWIVSRNARAEQIGDEEDPSSVTFRYEFSFLEELEATGRFYEIPGRLPQIIWELTIRNRSRRSIEIGELGFPLALNNVLDGFPRNDQGTREMFHDRAHIHKFIGGSASFVYAERMHGLPPGLLIYPGGDTKWEFYNHVPASLNTNFQWEGVPVVYVHSRAAIEREEWPEWFYGHTSTVLEPQEVRRYEMRFAPTDRFFPEAAGSSLAMVGRPTLRLFPAAVAPIDAGISMEVSGATPTRFWTDADIEIESDSDEEGGFCFVKPTEPRTLRIGFEDTAGRDSETQLLFTRPISELIVARADWITKNQIAAEAGLAGAIVSYDNEAGERSSDLRHFSSPFSLKCSLADALFLAEKNTAYRNEEQVRALDRYLKDFVEEKVRNPGDGSVGCILPSRMGAAACVGYPEMYPLCALLYATMARISSVHPASASPEAYLVKAAETALSLWSNALSDPILDGPIPLMSYFPALIEQLRGAQLTAQAERIETKLHDRWRRLANRRNAFASGGFWDATGFEEIICAARFVGDLDLKERVFRCLMAGKSAAPCWWWYGADKRWGPGVDLNDGALDNGELCLGTPTVSSSAMLFSLFARDYAQLPEAMTRMAFAGMLSVWALVREDGAAGMAFCPDAASAHFGMSATTGDIGVALYHYLQTAGSYVLPSLGTTLAVFCCQFDVDDEMGVEHYTIRPWDGVGRKVVVRQIGIEVQTSAGQITEVRFDSTKRKARVSLQNQNDKDLSSELVVKGLWGRRCRVAGASYEACDGVFRLPVLLPPSDLVRVDIEVCE